MRYQPQGRTRIDWANPITQGLRLWQVGANDGSFTNTNGVTTIATPSGIAKEYSAASSQYLSAEDDRVQSAPLTFFAIARVSAAATNKALISVGASTADRHLLYVTAEGRVAMFSGASSPTSTGQAIDVTAISSGRLHAIGGRVRLSNNRDVWVNGVKKNTNSSNVIPLPTNRIALGAYWSAGGPTANFFLDGAMPLALVWNRALSDDEMQSISGDPWQIFAAPEEDYETMAASAGVRHTLIAEGSSQASASTVAPAQQRHEVAAAATSQASTSAAAGVRQNHQITAPGASQAAAASAAEVGQHHQITGAESAQTGGIGAAAVSQRHRVTGAATSQANTPSIATLGAIRHILAGSTGSQANATITVAIKQRHRVAGEALAQVGALGAAAILQRHRIAAGALAQQNFSDYSATSAPVLIDLPDSRIYRGPPERRIMRANPERRVYRERIH